MPQRRLRNCRSATGSHGGLCKALARICGRDFLAVTAINFIVMSSYYLLFVTGAEYVHSELRTSLSVAGLSSGVMIIGCLAGRFISGNLINKTGSRLLLGIGLAFLIASIAFLFRAHNLALIFADRFLAGLSVGVAGTVTAVVAAHAVPASDKGLGISFFSLSTALALALGPFAGLLLMRHSGYVTMLGWTLAGMCLTLPRAIAVKNPQTITRHARPVFELRSYLDPRVFRFGLITLIIFLGYGCIQAFIAMLAMERGIAETASLFFLVYAVAVLSSRPFTGRQMDLHGENRVLYPLFLVIAVAFVILAFANSPAPFLLAAALFGLGFGNFQSIGQTVALSLVTPSRYAQATSTFFIFMDLGIGVGPYIFGFIVSSGGYEHMLIALASISLIDMVLYAFLHGRYSSYENAS